MIPSSILNQIRRLPQENLNCIKEVIENYVKGFGVLNNYDIYNICSNRLITKDLEYRDLPEIIYALIELWNEDKWGIWEENSVKFIKESK